MVATTTRGLFPKPEDTDNRRTVDLDVLRPLAERLAAAGALYAEGTAADRPLASSSNRGTLYLATDTGAVSFSTGTAWLPVQTTAQALNFGETADITASAPDDTAAAGATGEVADAGHRHAREAAPTQRSALHVLASISTDYAVAASVSLVLVNGSVTVTLPSASGSTGRQVIVKNTGSGTVAVASAAGQVEGAAAASLPPAHSITVVSNGINWFIV